MAYMCMGCLEIYDMELPMCPKAGCEGDVVEIDELMIPTIKILNKKGYYTSYCCSGHIYSNICNAYVSLKPFVTEMLEETEILQIKNKLPKSWTMEIGNDKHISFQHIICNCCEPGYEIEKWEDIVNANMELLRFVQQLPEIEC